MLENKLILRVLSFIPCKSVFRSAIIRFYGSWKRFMARLKMKDEKSVRQGIREVEQKFLSELKEIKAEIKKLRQGYETALTKRRLAALKKPK